MFTLTPESWGPVCRHQGKCELVSGVTLGPDVPCLIDWGHIQHDHLESGPIPLPRVPWTHQDHNPNNNRGLWWWSTGGENLSQWTPGCEQWDGSLLAIFWSILSLTRDFLLPRPDLVHVRTDYGPTLFTPASMVRVNMGRMYWNIMSSEACFL